MRFFLVVVLLLAVVIGVTGFARGWFSFSTSSEEETQGFTLKVDPGKVKKDRDAALALLHISKSPTDQKTERDQYQQQAETQFKQLDRDLEELKDKAKLGRAITKEKMNAAIADLHKKTGDTRTELRDLESASTAQWEAKKNHFGASMTALKNEYEQTSKRFMSELALTP